MRNDDGFTLVELLVGMTLSLVVLLAVLGIVDSFGAQAAANNRLTEAQDTSRRTMDQLVGQITSASTTKAANVSIGPIERQSADDLIVVSAPWTAGTTSTPGSTGVAQPVRYCIDQAGTLWSGTQTTYPTQAYVAPPVSSGGIPTTAECTNTMSGAWTYGALVRNLDTTQSSLAGDSRKKTIGITISMNIAGRANPLVLRSSATARNATQTPTVLATDFKCTKQSSTTGAIWIVAPSAGALTDADGAPITVDYYGAAPDRIFLGEGSIQLKSGGSQSIGIREVSVSSASAITDVTIGCPS